jgi:hypothetical protein
MKTNASHNIVAESPLRHSNMLMGGDPLDESKPDIMMRAGLSRRRCAGESRSCEDKEGLMRQSAERGSAQLWTLLLA